MSLLIQENIALAPLTSLQVGGAARFFAEAKTEADVLEALSLAREKDLPIFILGGGSNVLISDRGFDGLVLKIALKGIFTEQKNDDVLVAAGAGEDWEKFVEFCVAKNLQGVECLSGIPGTVGGTPVQNVGAYGQEVSETIVAVRVAERRTGRIFEMSNADCGFSYRQSLFNSTEKNRFIVLQVAFCLVPNGAPKIVYKDLRQFFRDQEPSLKDVRRAVLSIRAAKSMVIDERDPNSRSAGSFFKNPLVAREEFLEVKRRAREAGIQDIPNFEAGDGMVKIPAAWLIEKSGFHKGFKKGRAGLSENHTLAVVNLGGANAADILSLKNSIQIRVKEIFGVRLNPEPVFVGEMQETIID